MCQGIPTGKQVGIALELLESAKYGLSKAGKAVPFMRDYVRVKLMLLHNKTSTSAEVPLAQHITIATDEKLPVFSGEYGDWKAFEDSFLLQVGDKSHRAGPERLQRLKR